MICPILKLGIHLEEDKYLCCLNHGWNAKFSNFILGLSHLISFSISEDRYGVVQKDLSEVISILFALEKVIFKTKMFSNIIMSLCLSKIKVIFSNLFHRLLISIKVWQLLLGKTDSKLETSNLNKNLEHLWNLPFIEL